MTRPLRSTLAVVGTIELYCCILAIHQITQSHKRIDFIHGSKQHIHDGKLIGGVTRFSPSLSSLFNAALLSNPYSLT